MKVYLVRMNDAVEWVCRSDAQAVVRVKAIIESHQKSWPEQKWTVLIPDDGGPDRTAFYQRWTCGKNTIWIEPRQVDDGSGFSTSASSRHRAAGE